MQFETVISVRLLDLLVFTCYKIKNSIKYSMSFFHNKGLFLLYSLTIFYQSFNIVSYSSSSILLKEEKNVIMYALGGYVETSFDNMLNFIKSLLWTEKKKKKLIYLHSYFTYP